MTSQELDEIVRKLDAHLNAGSLGRMNVLIGYNFYRNQPDYNETQFLQEQYVTYNTWNREVEILLNEMLASYHFKFHFDVLKRAALHLTNFSRPVSDLVLTYESKLFALEDIILRLEERQQLMVRKEIAEQEHEADIAYKVSYNDHSREIKANNVLLCKLDFDSENHKVLSFIFANPNKPIGIEELEGTEVNGGPLAKRLSDIVRDAGFVKNLKDIFFPVVQKNKIMFINPITRKYAIDHDLPPLTSKDFGRNMEPKVDKTGNNEPEGA